MSGVDAYLAGIAAGNHSHVTLGNRGIDDATLLRVAEAIVLAKDTVVSVDVSENKAISSNGLAGFLDYLQRGGNKSVVAFSFENCSIDDAGAQSSLQYARENTHVKNLALDGNRVSEQLIESVRGQVLWNSQPSPVKRSSAAAVVDLSSSSSRITLTELSHTLEANNDIEFLNVTGCELGDHGAEVLGGLIANKQRLHTLILSSNRIGIHGIKGFFQSSNLKAHTGLRRLVVSNNKLSDEAARLLVDILKSNHYLNEIDTSDNGITQSASEMLQRAVHLNRQPLALKLAYFGVKDSDPQLTSIDFQWVEGMEESSDFLGPALKSNTTLLSMNLGNCSLGNKACEHLAPSLKVNKTLQTLALPNNGITTEGAIILAQALSQNTALTELNLANNRIDDTGALELVKALHSNRTLCILNVEHNDIGDELMTELEGLVTVNQCPAAVKPLLVQLETNAANISSIDFSQFDGDKYHNDASARVISQALLVNQIVTSVDFSNNAIGDVGAHFIADVLATNKTLKVLKLAQNAITDRGVAVLAEALLENNAIEELDLRFNKLGDAAGEVLLNMLQRNNSVQRLLLDGTRISVGLMNDIKIACNINTQPLSLKLALFRLSARDRSFSTLDLSIYDGQRYFTDDSVRILSHALSNNDYVTILNLRENAFGAGGVEALSSVLAERTCAIQSLSLAYNAGVDDNAARFLAAAIAENGSLVEIDLRGTSITDAGVAALSAALQQNNSVQTILLPETISPDAAASLARELMLNTQTLAFKATLPHVAANDASVTSLVIRTDGQRPINDVSLQLLCLALLSNNTVTKLDLAHNEITAAGVEYLVDLLNNNTTITHISLVSNRINDDGAKLLTKCLETNHSVVLIELEENPITEHCLAEVYYLLRINSGPYRLKEVMVAIASDDANVQSLNFNSSNTADRKFDDEAIHVLCSLLVDNHNVRSIDLRCNDVTDIGASLLADLLRANFTLEVLLLDHNCIGVEGAEALYQSLKANHVLHTLTTEGNAIPESTLENIAASLHVNAVPLKERNNLKGKRNFLELDDATQFRDTDYYQDKRLEITDHGYAEYEMRIRQMKLKRLQ